MPAAPTATDPTPLLPPGRRRARRWGPLAGLAAVVLAGSAALTACGSGAAPPADPTLAEGQQVFAANCAACHGPDGEGLNGPRLIGVSNRLSEEQEIAVVTNGRPGTAMPAWGSRLSPEQIAAVVAYTRSLTG